MVQVCEENVASGKYRGIPYEALDGAGRPVMREARTIGELPHESRLAACADAAKRIGGMIELSPVRSIPFGAPVYVAFGLTRPEAKAHSRAQLLLTAGCDVPLLYC